MATTQIVLSDFQKYGTDLKGAWRRVGSRAEILRPPGFDELPTGLEFTSLRVVFDVAGAQMITGEVKNWTKRNVKHDPELDEAIIKRLEAENTRLRAQIDKIFYTITNY